MQQPGFSEVDPPPSILPHLGSAFENTDSNTNSKRHKYKLQYYINEKLKYKYKITNIFISPPFILPHLESAFKITNTNTNTDTYINSYTNTGVNTKSNKSLIQIPGRPGTQKS